MYSLRDRVVVVTGAGSGIGLALTHELLSRGAYVIAADVSETSLAALPETDRIATFQLDVADRAAFLAFADEAIAWKGRVDGVINNAGVALQETLLETTFEDFDWLMAINFGGVLVGTKAFLPHMVERDSGFVVNISSVFGLIGVPTQSAYNASKFAVRGLTEALRQELDGTGVFATCVHPGGVKTNIARSARFYQSVTGDRDKQRSVDEFDRLARTTPTKAAVTILDGVERRAPRILVGRDARWIDRIVRAVPVRYTDLVKRVLSRRR